MVIWSDKVLLEGYLREKSRKKDTSKNKYYTLFEDRLVKYKVEKFTIDLKLPSFYIQDQ